MLHGRVTIIIPLLVPTFLYCRSSLPVPNVVIEELNTTTVDFAWDGKVQLIAYCTTVNRVAAGGLNLPYIESKTNAFRVKTVRPFNQCNAHSSVERLFSVHPRQME